MNNKIIDLKINLLETDEINIDLILEKTCTVDIYGEKFVIDRIRIFTGNHGYKHSYSDCYGYLFGGLKLNKDYIKLVIKALESNYKVYNSEFWKKHKTDFSIWGLEL